MKNFSKVFVGNFIFSIIILFVVDMFSGVNVSAPDVSMGEYLFYLLLVNAVFLLASLKVSREEETIWNLTLLAFASHLFSMFLLIIISNVF